MCGGKTEGGCSSRPTHPSEVDRACTSFNSVVAFAKKRCSGKMAMINLGEVYLGRHHDFRCATLTDNHVYKMHVPE